MADACAGLLNARISRCNTKHRFQIGGCRDDGQAAHKRSISKKDNAARPPLTATALMEVLSAGADVRTGPPAPAKAAAAAAVAAGAAAGAVDPVHEDLQIGVPPAPDDETTADPAVAGPPGLGNTSVTSAAVSSRRCGYNNAEVREEAARVL